MTKTEIQKVDVGDAKDLVQVLAKIAPEPTKVPAPSKVPLPRKLTDEQKEALDKFPAVYGQVVPQERRALEVAEASALLDEKDTLKTIKKLAADREQDIRTTVFNHLDVLVEEEGLDESAERDDKGHYVVAGEVFGEDDSPHKFVRQVSEQSPALSEAALRELSEDPEVEFTHDDYLAMTSPIRVVDENKVMLELKKRPELLSAIQKAVTPGRKSASLYARKR